MAKKVTRSSARAAAKVAADRQDEIRWPFGKKNYLVFGLALLVIVVGYVTLGYGSMTLAPVLLVLGYCVLIPVAIVIRDRTDESRTATDGATSSDLHD